MLATAGSEVPDHGICNGRAMNFGESFTVTKMSDNVAPGMRAPANLSAPLDMPSR
jgi:hypothetical protein